MPSFRADSPAEVADQETLEYLLGKRNSYIPRFRTTKAWQGLSSEERRSTNLVALGKRTETIQGDPFGVLAVWAGNVGHPRDERMVGWLA